MNKQIIERRLPLNVKYVCTDKKYISLIDGTGCACDNCGKLIANIATVKSINGTYNIGFDCLETFLLNNNLLEDFNLEDYEKVKKWVTQSIRLLKQIKQTIDNNRAANITGLKFERPKYDSDFYPFYWLKNNQTDSRDNDYLKAKGMNFDFLIKTLSAALPKLNIVIH